MAGFADLLERVKSLQSVHAKLPEPIADELSIQIPREFATESDPYGNRWKELSPITIAKKGHGQILYRTGEMLMETRAIASGNEIRFEGPSYGPFHQRDRRNRWGTITPARPVIPNESELPMGWQRVISDEFGKAVSAALQR